MTNLHWLFILSAAVYFLQGIEGLPGLAIQLWMKETLHIPAYEVQRLLSYITLAWLVKPIWGFLIDTFKSKKWWIYLSLFGGIGICTLLTFLPLPSLVVLILLMALLNWTISIRDVANDGIACIAGKDKAVTGKFQAIQWGAINVAAVLATLGGGYLAEKYANNWQYGYGILIPLLFLLIPILKRAQVEDEGNVVPSLRDYKLLLNKDFVLVAIFMLLYGTAPAFGVPLLYMKRDIFHWTPMQIAYLDVFILSIELIGAYLYFKYCKVLPIKKTLIFSILLGIPATLCYLYYTPFTAWLYGGLLGSIGMIIFLVGLDFCARKSIKGLEATSFAALMSIKNLSSWLSAQLGALTLQYWGLPTTIVISAFAGLVALPLVKYIKWEE